MRGSNPTKKRTSRQILAAAIAATAVGALPFVGGSVLAQGLEIEEIIVTAQRREQSIEDVPLSVSQLRGERLTALFEGGDDIRALATRLPSLYAESSNGRLAPRFYMRGLGNTDFDLAASQQVSVLFDEVVQENVILKSFPLFDIDRVEVLRGPQGSLFGRNTPAGIVKFDTVKPSDEFDAYGLATVGSYGTLNLEGAVGGALNDNGTLMGRFSFLSQNRDDWISNDFTGESDVMGGFNELAWRAQLMAAPSDNVRVLLSVHGRDMEGTASIFRANVLDSASNRLNENYIRDTVFFDEGDNNPQEAEAYGGQLRLELDFENGTTLTSITGVETVENRSKGDIDGGNMVTGPGFIPFPSVTEDGLTNLEQFTQELRLSGENADGMFWQGGLFYFNSDFTVDTNPFFVPSSQVQHQNEAWALFGQLSLPLNDKLTLTGGLRYTDDKKDARAFNAPGGSIAPVTVKGEQTSFDVSLMWDVSEGLNLYGRVANGFRAPSIQGRDVAFGGGMTTARAETIISSEVGFKINGADGRVLLNGAFFHYTIDDMQLTAIGGASNLVQLLNAEKGEGTGMDVDASFLITENFIVTAGLSFVETEIKDDTITVTPCPFGGCTVLNPPDGQTGNVFINGNPFPGAPDSTFNLTARYGIPTDSGEIFFFTDYAYQGKTNFFLYDSAEFSSDGNFEWGLRAGYIHGENDWEIAVFGRNITDEENLKGAIDFNNNTGFDNEPRIWGITFRKNWGN